MLERIKTTIKPKGQGIIEYALILAFVVGIGMVLMSGGGIKDSVKGVFDDVANVFAGSKYDLSTPEGRLAADKARIKKLGEALAANFKKNKVKDDFDKADNPVELNGDYLSILVLPDGSLNIFSAANGGKWLTELETENPTTYNSYVSALRNVGIDLSNAYISDTVVKNSKEKEMGTTQYYTDSNFKLYSSGDEGGLNNGYAISFTKLDNKMQLKYYELNNPYTKEDLGTMYVPRSWLANGDSNNKASDDGKDKYPNKLTTNLEVD